MVRDPLLCSVLLQRPCIGTVEKSKWRVRARRHNQHLPLFWRKARMDLISDGGRCAGGRRTRSTSLPRDGGGIKTKAAAAAAAVTTATLKKEPCIREQLVSFVLYKQSNAGITSLCPFFVCAWHGIICIYNFTLTPGEWMAVARWVFKEIPVWVWVTACKLLSLSVDVTWLQLLRHFRST